MKLLRFILPLFSSLIVVIVIDQYLFCPVYSFADTTPFSGDSIYNPYASITSGEWVKCNFHAHSHCWDGFTYGYGTAEDIHRIYNQLHYGVHAVSNYQHIDTTAESSPAYLSSYEHGYNILKSHQLVLGANTVCWKDYFLPQTPGNKQDIIDHLFTSDPNGLIIINHPLERNGYSSSDLKHLTRYSCMEVLNPACNSSALWDAALSAGKPVFIIGDDDLHNVLDTNKVGKICTWINTSEVNETNILQAIRTGSAYGMTIGKNLQEKERHGDNDISMPKLKSFTMQGDTMRVKFNMKAGEIIISGENGYALDKVLNNDSVSFKLGNNSYARITAKYEDGTQLLLNPVFRYNKSPLYEAGATINSSQTLLFRTTGTMMLLLWFSLVFKLPLPRRTQNKLLPNFATTGYEHISDSAKIIRVWCSRIIWHMYRFFDNMGIERKNEIE